MDEASRQRLVEKKKWVQAQQEVITQSKQLADWWLPALQLVRQSGIEWKLEYFNCITGLSYTHWQNQLQHEPWLSAEPHKLILKEQASFYVHENVLKHFPNHHPLRYLPQLSFTPSLSSNTDQQVLTEAFQRLGLKDEPVYFFFMRLPPVLVLQFSDLVKLAGNGLLPSLEDICITPANYNWLTFRSLEDEWQFGKRQS